MRRARLEEAARLLRQTGLPVQDVADQVGYRSPTAFIRAFGRQYGCPPLRYRHLNMQS
jgi:AraC-like DNA-binding protein